MVSRKIEIVNPEYTGWMESVEVEFEKVLEPVEEMRYALSELEDIDPLEDWERKKLESALKWADLAHTALQASYTAFDEYRNMLSDSTTDES